MSGDTSFTDLVNILLAQFATLAYILLAFFAVIYAITVWRVAMAEFNEADEYGREVIGYKIILTLCYLLGVTASSALLISEM